MPFKSEKQRRYLWANEPEIARDWTDTYGSKIHAADGGIMRLPFAEAGAVGTLTASEISDLESMAQTYPGTKIGDEAQRKLDINAGKAVEEKEAGFFEGLLGFGKAEGAEMGNTAEDQVRKEFFDYGTQQADIGEYANLKIPGYYTPRNTAADTAAKFYQSDDVTGNFDDYESGFEGFEDADEQAAYDTYASGLSTLKNKFNFPSLNFRNIGTGIQTAFSLANDTLPFGLARQGFDALTSGFNRNRTMTPQQQANQNYINQYGRTPQGRLATGDFAGLNAPGTSMFGSKSQQEMAQNWMNKYGNVDYTTPKMQQKKTSIAAQATGDGGNNNNNAGVGGPDAGYAAAGGTGMHGGKHYNRGGLASLWQK